MLFAYAILSIYSTFLRRRNTITPKKTSANTAQAKRIIELSIFGSPFRRKCHNGRYMLTIIGISSRVMRTNMGPTVTTKSDGKIQKKIGNTSLTPSLAAFSSAICRV
jgi:hypothetical protein